MGLGQREGKGSEDGSVRRWEGILRKRRTSKWLRNFRREGVSGAVSGMV